MSKLPADLSRFLFLVPFVASHREGVPAEELASMLSMNVKQLGRLLDRVAMVGAPDGGPDEMVEIYLEAGRVFVALPQRFVRPPRFSVDEMAALLLALAPLQGLPVLKAKSLALADRLTTLASQRAEALAPTLRQRLVVRADGCEDPAHLQRLEQAVEEHLWVDARYYTAGRDVIGNRRIAPIGLLQVRGVWYAAGLDEKVFRVERFEELELTEEHFEIPEPMDLHVLRKRLESMSFGGGSVRVRMDGEEKELGDFGAHALRRWIRISRQVELLSPQHERQALIDETKELLDRYRTST